MTHVKTSPMQDDSIYIRAANLANPDDASAYRKMLAAYALDPMGGEVVLPNEKLEKVTEDLATSPQARAFLAFADGKPVGFATCFSTYSTFNAKPLWNIHDIAVLREFRGMGIGRAIIRQIAEAASHEGCCKLTLEVREDNRTADKLYRSLGFTAADFGTQKVQYLFLEKAL